MPNKTPKLLPEELLREAAECLKILAHPARLRIVDVLMQGDFPVARIAGFCNLPPHQTSEHLRLLRSCGSLSDRREGRSVYYQIADPRLPGLLRCIRSACQDATSNPRLSGEFISMPQVSESSSSGRCGRGLCAPASVVSTKKPRSPSWRGASIYPLPTAACPYHIGGQIADRQRLLVQTVAGMRKRYRIDVRTGCEAVSIDRTAKTVWCATWPAGVKSRCPMKRLVLSPAPNDPPGPCRRGPAR
jgi:DNA-binding transcriptional ArsR family regulator